MPKKSPDNGREVAVLRDGDPSPLPPTPVPMSLLSEGPTSITPVFLRSGPITGSRSEGGRRNRGCGEKDSRLQNVNLNPYTVRGSGGVSRWSWNGRKRSGVSTKEEGEGTTRVGRRRGSQGCRGSRRFRGLTRHLSPQVKKRR